MTRCAWLTAAAVAVVLVMPAAPAADGKRLITETDLYAFQWIADPRISPDGAQIVYTRVVVNAKHDGYESALWLIPAAGAAGGRTARQITAGPHDTSPRWSPDGRRIAFLRSTETPERPPSGQIFVLPMDGGEARPLTAMPKGASAPEWSPDGRFIAFTSSTKQQDFEKKDSPEEPPSDVRVITRAEYRLNGRGYYEPGRPDHIWSVQVPAALDVPPPARQITKGEFSEADPVWSHDGTQIYFDSERVLEPYYEPPHDTIYAVSASGGDGAAVASIDGPIHALSLSPDGRQLAFIGEQVRAPGGAERSYSRPELWVTGVQPGAAPKRLTPDYDYDIGGSVGGDQAPPRGASPSKPYWSADSRLLFVVAAELGRTNLKRVSVEPGAAAGQVSSLTMGDNAILAYSATPDGARVAALISTPTNIGDLYLIDGPTGKRERITDVNAELFSQLNLTDPEMVWYKSFDGRRIQSWVQRPPEFEDGKKYPLILDIHGGPHAAYGFSFDHEIQWLAARGYVVLYPNPRGSTSYGQAFGNSIQYTYPGDDYKDLMAGVDELIDRGWVDPERMGVTGGSGGGLLTNWVIGHTNRFKAAVSQRSIADWRDFWYTADFTLFTPLWFRGAPWEQEADFKARSPITYIQDVHTPLMLMEGEADLRTPPGAGGEQMFRALKYLRRPVVMVRFPGETHELSRSGKPLHRVERLRHIAAWLDKYVLGREIHTYDLQ
ncbi:MAG: S9 family peptidase [Bryobacteraceae bacterium]